jgi:hypothetical protein
MSPKIIGIILVMVEQTPIKRKINYGVVSKLWINNTNHICGGHSYGDVCKL